MKRLLILAALALMLGGEARASFIVGWDFDPQIGGSNNFGISPLAATTVTGAVSTGGWIRNHSILSGNTGASNAWGSNNFNTTTPSFSSAVANNNFFTVTLTPNSGNQFSFSQISAYNIRRSNSGPTTGRWQYRIGTGAYTDIGSDITWGSVATSAGNSQSAISLTSISTLQNVSSSVTFRIVTWGATSATGTWYLNDPSGTPGSDISFSGNVSAVPEPTTGLLLGIGTLACAAFRRNRRVA
jgi:hypothetical protein